MERKDVRRRNRLILEAQDETRALGRDSTAKEIDGKVCLKDPALYAKWKASQDWKHRRSAILQVLRDERRPTAAAASQKLKGAELSPSASAAPPPPLPPLLWPRGMRQRKDSDPKFKLPLLYGYPGGSERVFCECLGDRTLHEVTVTLAGRPVCYSPAVRPGTFIELNWEIDPELNRSVTYNGWRGHLLALESYESLASTFPESNSSPTAEAMRPLAEFAAHQVEQTRKVLPPEGLETWKHEVRGYLLEIQYMVDGGAVSGQLSGTLLMTMEDLWIGFKDDKGHETPIR